MARVGGWPLTGAAVADAHGALLRALGAAGLREAAAGCFRVLVRAEAVSSAPAPALTARGGEGEERRRELAGEGCAQRGVLQKDSPRAQAPAPKHLRPPRAAPLRLERGGDRVREAIDAHGEQEPQRPGPREADLAEEEVRAVEIHVESCEPLRERAPELALGVRGARRSLPHLHLLPRRLRELHAHLGAAPCAREGGALPLRVDGGAEAPPSTFWRLVSIKASR